MIGYIIDYNYIDSEFGYKYQIDNSVFLSFDNAEKRLYEIETLIKSDFLKHHFNATINKVSIELD